MMRDMQVIKSEIRVQKTTSSLTEKKRKGKCLVGGKAIPITFRI